MALNKCKLGEHIELREVTNDNLRFGPDDVRGVNNLKLLMPTKADINGRDLTKFQIVYPGEFVFNHRTSRNGSKFSIAYNDGENPVICTEDYVVFRIKETSKQFLIAEWLYMYFNRPEFDRYVITNSWGSSTEFYNWEDICTVDLSLPSLSVQQKYVGIYKAMIANQAAYERGLEDLKLVCDGYIEDLRRKIPCEKIGKYISRFDERNGENGTKNVMGMYTLGTPRSDFVEACQTGLRQTQAILQTYLEEMEEGPLKDNTPQQSDDFYKIFIVHGHDGELKQSVARIIEKQGIEAIILSEQANQGRTIIEKFIDNSDVSGAICLFTADDFGRRKDAPEDSLRARQNVVFEAGFFIGKLGREKTVILADADLEIPSDLSGVVYTSTRNWEIELLKELKAMGYRIDLNKLF